MGAALCLDDDADCFTVRTSVMNTIQTILVAVSRSPNAQQALSKAVILARRFGARVELFLCDAERAFELSHEYDARGVEGVRKSCIEESRAYLETLSATVDTSGVEITIDASCESPEYEGIARKVIGCRPELVVRNVGDPGLAHPDALSEKDWDIVRACPALVLLTRSKPWPRHPKLAAAVDISPEETPEIARTIIETAQYFTHRCEGELEILNCMPRGASPAEIESQKYKLYDRAHDVGALPVGQHVCAGDAAEMLPSVAADRNYDAIVLGALTHRHTFAALVGSVTGKMLDTLHCDFLLVKPAAYVYPFKEAVRSGISRDRA
jgi:universal stress protein E